MNGRMNEKSRKGIKERKVEIKGLERNGNIIINDEESVKRESLML